jgi:hypothetical protein
MRKFYKTLLVHAVRFPGKGGILPTKALLREEANGCCGGRR